MLQVKKELQQEKENSSTVQKDSAAPEEVSTLKRSLEVIFLPLCLVRSVITGAAKEVNRLPMLCAE